MPSDPPPDELMDAHGLLSTALNVRRFSQDLVVDMKVEIAVEAETPDGVRWYFTEWWGLGSDEAAWLDMERQLARYEM
jgi:hypothetical protein